MVDSAVIDHGRPRPTFFVRCGGFSLFNDLSSPRPTTADISMRPPARARIEDSIESRPWSAVVGRGSSKTSAFSGTSYHGRLCDHCGRVGRELEPLRPWNW